MNCKIKIQQGSGTLHSWSDDCIELIDLLVQPIPSQKESRIYQTTQLRAFNLAGFLKASGVKVEVDIENPSEHARLTIWTQKLKAARTDISENEVTRFLSDLRVDFRDLQVQGLKKVLRSHFALVAALCGSGKTLLNLTVAQFKKSKTGKVLTFVITPSACAHEYLKELDRFRGYFDLTMVDTCGLAVTHAESMIRDEEADIFLVSVDSIEQLKSTISAKLQEFNGETLLVVEEGHTVKNVNSRRSVGLQIVAPLFDQVIVSTATPMPLGPKDIRGYIGLVGLPQPEGAYANGIPTHDYALLRGVAFVTDEEDIEFAPIDSEYLEYSDLEELNNRIADAVNVEVSAGHKVVIFASTNLALETAYNLFQGIPRTVLSGSFYTEDCKGEELLRGRNCEFQKHAIDQFNHNPDCKILIANYRVGSTGLNLQYSGARMAIFYEITNSGADFFQSKYRIRRPNVFPKNGFKYLYAMPRDPRRRRNANRQFLKLADQKSLLKRLKEQTGVIL